MHESRGPRHWVQIQATKLNTADALAFLEEGNVGAVNLFVGKTRRFTDGRETLRLEYELYPEMTVPELERIAEEALGRWPLEKVLLIHRFGEVKCGEASVIVGASAPHRSEAFDACRFLIDTLKAKAPIWKKENYADGSEEWVGTEGNERA
ncbi:MAG: molybdenum cofactor biosynthesis protein MoaE [Rhodothermia bacterium]|nr:molybdenum cofactor biosynthesis protein MoaE [Rhodothermia bacterium]